MTGSEMVIYRLECRADFLQKFIKRAEAHIRLRSSESLVATLTADQEQPLAVYKGERIAALMAHPRSESEAARPRLPSWEEKIEDAKTELSNIEEWVAALKKGGMLNVVEDVFAAGLMDG